MLSVGKHATGPKIAPLCNGPFLPREFSDVNPLMALGVHHRQLTFEFQVLESGGGPGDHLPAERGGEVTEMDQVCRFLSFTLWAVFAGGWGLRDGCYWHLSFSFFSGKRCHA